MSHRLLAKPCEVQELARELAGDLTARQDILRAFLDHVSTLPYRDTEEAGTALECLRVG